MILDDDIYDLKFSLKTDFTFFNVFLNVFLQFFKMLFCLFKQCFLLISIFLTFKNDFKINIF